MDERQLKTFAERESRPTAMDVQRAKEAILHYFSEQEESCVVTGDTLISVAQRGLVPDDPPPPPGPIPDGYLTVTPDLCKFKAERASREAVQLLHSTGVLAAYGPIVLDSSNERLPMEKRIQFSRQHSSADVATLPLLSLRHSYALSTAFMGDRFRLSNADVYMSALQRDHLSSRVQRCLRECIDAFRHGLFLSAVMNAGAASESLWNELGHLVESKGLPSTELAKQLKAKNPSIGTIIDETWQVLKSHCSKQLRDVIGGSTELESFKSRTDTFRYLRNYAMHNDDADVDEPRFTYDETGLLLLNAADYFNKLVQLRLKVNELGATP